MERQGDLPPVDQQLSGRDATGMKLAFPSSRLLEHKAAGPARPLAANEALVDDSASSLQGGKVLIKTF